MQQVNKEGTWREKVKRPSPEFPRHYLKESQEFKSWEQIEPIMLELKNRSWSSSHSFHQWIDDYCEFSDALHEEESRLYIDMTCDTQDKEKEAAFLNFVENIEPKMAPLSDELNKKICMSPFCDTLDANEFGQWIKSLKVRIELFHTDNIPLHTEISRISQQYQKLSSELTVEWEGETKTLSQMGPILELPQREKREAAWKKIAERRSEAAEQFETIFDQLFQLRCKVAEKLGCKNFIDYSFRAYQREDYNPEDCYSFHDAVEKIVVPKYRAILAQRSQQLGIQQLRPWDLSCDPLGRDALKPFARTEELVNGVGRIFSKIDPELHEFFSKMVDLGLLDLDNRRGKAPGGYQCGLDESRLPFIFMNSVGQDGDVYTLLHESGHAFHQFLTRNQKLGFNRHAPMEFSEVASMSMERIGSTFLNEFYNPEQVKRSLQMQDEEVFRLLCWVAMIDAFQMWLYTHPQHSREDRAKAWIDLDKRFGSCLDWSGLEEYRGRGWHRQLHIFEVPFYYIEYGIAQLGALQLWTHYTDSPGKALEAYKRGLSSGGTLRLTQLFERSDCKFSLHEETIEPLVRRLWERWQVNAKA